MRYSDTVSEGEVYNAGEVPPRDDDRFNRVYKKVLSRNNFYKNDPNTLEGKLFVKEYTKNIHTVDGLLRVTFSYNEYELYATGGTVGTIFVSGDTGAMLLMKYVMCDLEEVDYWKKWIDDIPETVDINFFYNSGFRR